MRILLAEDEVELTRALTTILQHHQFSVDVVYNGKDALTYLESGVYDGAILDIMMPAMNGLSVVHELRAQGNPVPIMLLTAKSDIDDRVAGLDAGADDYMTKPFSTKELLARVRAMTRRQTPLIQNTMTFENLTLDRATYLLSTPDGSFRLSNKEFQIMEMLMINPGHVISTERFMDKIWGFESDTELNVVWVYLSYLRKKLQTINANVRIKANRNLGYVLEKKS
ncbi:MAG: response regulator transcription factor [Clostridia bacterium]|nr:response regulator transcription factor [Clostridia bacterium]